MVCKQFLLEKCMCKTPSLDASATISSELNDNILRIQKQPQVRNHRKGKPKGKGKGKGWKGRNNNHTVSGKGSWVRSNNSRWEKKADKGKGKLAHWSGVGKGKGQPGM